MTEPESTLGNSGGVVHADVGIIGAGPAGDGWGLAALLPEPSIGYFRLFRRAVTIGVPPERTNFSSFSYVAWLPHV
jgi:hypothetical protein